jgi:hypothetical protein
MYSGTEAAGGAEGAPAPVLPCVPLKRRGKKLEEERKMEDEEEEEGLKEGEGE